jgi:hypothetical protein
MTHPGHGPDPDGKAVSDGATLHEFDESDGAYVTEQPPAEERVRRAPTDLLERAATSGGNDLWVRLARSELARRGVQLSDA